MKKTLSIAFAALLLFGTSCLKKKDTGCQFNECSRVAPASESASIEAYLTSNGITNTVRHCSGAYYTIVNPGTGAAADGCSTVNVAYGGYLTNGNRFDSSAQASFPLGGLIAAWPALVPKIRVGGEMIMYVPPSLGYGSSANGSIPANSILIFRVKLFEVQ